MLLPDHQTFIKIIYPRNNPSYILNREVKFSILSFYDDLQLFYAIYTPYLRNHTFRMPEKKRFDKILEWKKTFLPNIFLEIILIELYTLNYCFVLNLADSLDEFLFNLDLIEDLSLSILQLSSYISLRIFDKSIMK